MSEKILSEIQDELRVVSNLLDAIGDMVFADEFSAAHRRLKARAVAYAPESALLHRIAGLLRTAADYLEQEGWTFQAEDALAAADKADELAALAKKEGSHVSQ